MSSLIRITVGVHTIIVCLLLLMIPQPPRSPLFPYTTLFRSLAAHRVDQTPATHVQRRILRVDHAGQLNHPAVGEPKGQDRKSTRLNSSHEWMSYAVFCVIKKPAQVVVPATKHMQPLVYLRCV